MTRFDRQRVRWGPHHNSGLGAGRGRRLKRECEREGSRDADSGVAERVVCRARQGVQGKPCGRSNRTTNNEGSNRTVDRGDDQGRSWEERRGQQASLRRDVGWAASRLTAWGGRLMLRSST
jgi:hypothetical protein